MPPTPEQVAADKAAIDTELMRLLRASRQRVTLPQPVTDPGIGPYSHARSALGVVKRAALLKHVEGFEDGWLDLLLRERQGMDRPWVPTLEALAAGWKKKPAADARRLAEARGRAVLASAKGEVLVLCPLGPGARVYRSGPQGTEMIGRSVVEFVAREVAKLLGEPVAPLEEDAPAAKQIAQLGQASAEQQRRWAKLCKTQPESSTVHGALTLAWSLRDLASVEAAFALDELAREGGLTLFAGCGDLGSTPIDSPILLGHWLVGVELAAARGGAEQRAGFTFDAATVALATGRLDAVAKAVRAFCKAHAGGAPERGAYLVARGGLPFASLVKGRWVDAPASARRGTALETWLDEKGPRADREQVGYARGTKGASQEAFPAVVHGLVVGSADACAEPIEWTVKRDRAIDRHLARAGIDEARYHLLLRFD